MNDKKLAIVIPAWNQWAYTKRTLLDLVPLPKDHCFIVVDNGSSDATKGLTSLDRLHVVRHSTNLGFAKGCNSGFERAVSLGYDNVMFLNNDIRASQDAVSTWTEPLISCAQDGFIVGPTAGCLDEQFNFICESSKLPTRGNYYLSGWNITASTKTWQRLILEGDVGPFSTKFISYFEDTDLSFRARELGIKLTIVNVPVRHIGKVTGKKVGLGPIYLQSKKTFIEIWGKK